MIRKLVIVVCFTVLALPVISPAAGAAPEDRPRLKAEATVTSDIVRIGDLVANAGIVADVPIFRAPDLGSTGMVSAQAVVNAVRAHALIGLDPGDVREVVVTRASRTVAPQEIESRVAEALAAQFALGNPKDVLLRFDEAVNAIHVEPTAKGEPRVARLSYASRSGRFDAVVAIPSHRPLRLTGHAIPMAEVVTIAEPIARGDIIKQSDVAMQRRPRRDIAADTLTDTARAVGLAARVNMHPGRVLRAVDLTHPELVRRNETVTLIYRVPGINLTVRGRATEGGAEGDIIGVLNEQTNRTMHGTVTGPGQVTIKAAATRLAAGGPAAEAVHAQAR
jgi:flagella basal body P-ring formation protein FlgA